MTPIPTPNRFRISRFLITAGFLIAAFYLYVPYLVPHIADSGVVGLLNKGIIIALICLSARQFFYLFFSVCEEMRRQRLPTEYKLHPISIIVPAYNEAVVISDTIDILKQLDYPVYEVIVIDDGSTDGTFQVATRTVAGDRRFKVLRKANGGKANALNMGIQNSVYDYIFCMDADSVLEANSLRFGIRHFADPEVAAVAGSVLVQNRTNWVTSFQTVEYLTGLNFFKAAQSFLGLVTIIPGPSGLFKKSAVYSVGGYEPDTYAEDCDLTLKLATASGKVVYEPYMEVRTEIPDEIIPLIRQRYRWNRGILQALRKHLRRGITNLWEPHVIIIVVYMVLEALALPLVNVLLAGGSLIYQFSAHDFSLFSLWLFVLIFLDLAILLVTLADTRWPLRLVFYTIINRFTYAFFHDIIRILSSIEELAGIRMSWGKLERIGSK